MQDGDILDAKGRMVLEEQHPPDHSKGSYANNIRNQDMVTEGANACFGFPTPESTGTLDCMARAWVKGIDTYVFHHLEPGRFHKLTEDEGEHLARRMLKWGS
jgi:hypothetical protein